IQGRQAVHRARESAQAGVPSSSGSGMTGSFQEAPAGLALAEPMGLADRFMWGNDYPHHEGTWPHSAEAIDRARGRLSDGARANVLGLTAARFFGFPVPAGRGAGRV